jgi:glutamate-1-semialdehyde 2,1-aminomutase
MTAVFWLYFIYVTIALFLLRKIQIRLRLSRAKHPSLRGHSKMSRFVAKLVPFYEYDEERFFNSDGAPVTVAQQRQAGFERLRQQFSSKSPKSIAMTQALESSISDVLFTNAYRVPFQYRNYVKKNLKLGTIATASAGTMIKDLDDNWSYDLSGSVPY